MDPVLTQRAMNHVFLWPDVAKIVEQIGPKGGYLGSFPVQGFSLAKGACPRPPSRCVTCRADMQLRPRSRLLRAWLRDQARASPASTRPGEGGAGQSGGQEGRRAEVAQGHVPGAFTILDRLTERPLTCVV